MQLRQQAAPPTEEAVVFQTWISIYSRNLICYITRNFDQTTCQQEIASMGRTIAVIILVLVFSAVASAQSSNATLGGTVSDSTGALIPGVTVTATNTQTGIVANVVTNETGAYQFSSLQTGVYKVT